MDNTVGSLTQLQRSVVIGSVLGDGYLRIVPGRADALLEVNHSLSQAEYVKWKFYVLTGLVAGEPRPRRSNGERIAVRFYTKQHPELTEIMQTFYRKGKKVVPDNIKIDPVILAVWYMDDDSKCRDSDVYLNTQQFDHKSQENLLDALQEFGLHATLNKDKSYERIRFLKSSAKDLNKIIDQYIVPSMRYKLSYDPVETTRRSPALQVVG